MFNFNIVTFHLFLQIVGFRFKPFLPLCVRSVSVSIISKGAILIFFLSDWLGFCLANTLTVEAAGKLICWHLHVLAQIFCMEAHRTFW